MKQISVLIIVLVMVIFFGIWELSYLKESSRYMLSDIKDIYQTTVRGEYDTAKRDAQSLRETWKKVRITWALFINDGEIDDLEEKLVAFVSYIDNENQDEIKVEYNNLTSKVKHVVDFQSIKVENVF